MRRSPVVSAEHLGERWRKEGDIRLPEREVGGLPPGVGVSYASREPWRAAGKKGYPGCQPCFLHPGPPHDSLNIHTHTQPRSPQISICCPILHPLSEIPPAQHIAKGGGVFCSYAILSTGAAILPTPPLLEFSCMTALLFLIGVFPECSRKHFMSGQHHTAQTPF